jgi:hypothetical protein
MSSSHKTPLSQSLNRFTKAKIEEAISQQGKSLPCSVVAVVGGIVEVKFEVVSGFLLPNVVIPVSGSEYYRLPIQIGDLGVVMAVDTRMTNVNGLGALTPPDLTQSGNLTSLVFVPVGNTAWWPMPGDQAVVYGPNGVVLGNRIVNPSKPPAWLMTTYFDLTTDQVVVSIKNNAVTLTMTETGVTIKGNTTITGNLHVTGTTTSDTDVVSGTIRLRTHIHQNSGGSGNGGIPVA